MNQLHGIIDRFEGEYAVITFRDGNIFLWPQKNLSGLHAGNAVKITLSPNIKETQARYQKNQTLLNDILNKNNSF